MGQKLGRLAIVVAGVLALPAVFSTGTKALAPDSAPPLPAPSGAVVNVSTVSQLQAAAAAATSNQTIVIAPGTYNLTSTLWIGGSISNLTLRGATNNRNDVVLVGKGMGVNDANVPFGIWTGNGVTGLTIANLTIRDIYQHPIMFNAGTQSPRVYNVRLVDAGQQFIKSSPDGAGGGVNNGVVEYSVIEYTNTAPNDYTNGVDVHTGQNWIIRHNLFRRIRAPQGLLAGPAILMWNASSGSIAEGNTFVDCQREISFGLIERTPNDHTGGVIRNNMIVRNAGMGGDVGIGIMDSPGTAVVNNTIFLNGQYPNAIEYRFANTSGVSITNNLGDRGAQARDGASATLQANVWTAAANWFVAPATGDLHLTALATGAIDTGIVPSQATVDWDAEPRLAGAAVDAGADERQGSTPPPDTTAPAVSVTAPSAGATITGTMNLTASASDNVGVTSVWFTLDGSTVGAEDSTAPYSVSWNSTTATNGSHVLRAMARDAAGNTGSSTTITVTVSNTAPDTTAPTVSVTAPAGGTTVSGSVTLTASASDNVGVSGVRFTVDGQNVGTEDTTAPYSVAWNTATATNGSHTVRAVARDAAGNATTSSAITVTVSNTTPDTTLPTVSMTAPAVSATVSGTVTVSASASDNVGVVGVQFTLDGVNLGTEDTTSPYSLSWNTATAANGARTLRAIARDAAGNTRTSTARTVTVSNTVADTTLPNVAITAPGQSATVSGSLALTASASDNVGVVGVQFLVDGVNVGAEDTSAPYTVTWASSAVRNGTHVISARARDAAGNQRTSTGVSVRVRNWGSRIAGDLNDDGVADLIFRRSTGELNSWLLAGAARSSESALTAASLNPVWALASVDDFDGDGKSDLLWQNSTNGQLYVWYMDRGVLVDEGYIAMASTPWRVITTADFNRDGSTDILWMSPSGSLALWFMQGATKASSIPFGPGAISPSWRLAGTGDFNRDGSIDLLWQNRVTGEIHAWMMGGTTVLSSGPLTPGATNPSWEVRAVVDLDADGSSDLVFQHATAGYLYAWFLSGTTLVRDGFFSPSQIDPAWQVVGQR